MPHSCLFLQLIMIIICYRHKCVYSRQLLIYLVKVWKYMLLLMVARHVHKWTGCLHWRYVRCGTVHVFYQQLFSAYAPVRCIHQHQWVHFIWVTWWFQTSKVQGNPSSNQDISSWFRPTYKTLTVWLEILITWYDIISHFIVCWDQRKSNIIMRGFV